MKKPQSGWPGYSGTVFLDEMATSVRGLSGTLWIDGVMVRTRKLMLDHCRACGKELRGRQREYCSQECVAKILGPLPLRAGDGTNRRGIKQRGLCAKSPKHHRASEFALVKNGIIYLGRNIMHFVRSNPDLFDAGDVVWKPQSREKTWSGAVYCTASKRLSALSPSSKKGARSWKGWQWASLSNNVVSLTQEPTP